MTTPVSATKDKSGALYNRGFSPSLRHKKIFLWENSVCKFIFYSIYGFNILLACIHLFIIIWNTSQASPLWSVWSRRVIFPPFLVKILLLGSKSWWERCLSYTVSVQLEMPVAYVTTTKLNEVEKCSLPNMAIPSPLLQLAAGTGEHQPQASCGIQKASCKSNQSNFIVHCPICTCTTA